jgi:ABC-2 type transport system permease protein
MIGRVLLIAERDWLANVRAGGFWVALLAVQLLVILGAVGGSILLRPPPVRVAAVATAEPVLRAAAMDAIEAARLAGAPVRLALRGERAADLTIRLQRRGEGAVLGIDGDRGMARRLTPFVEAAVAEAGKREALIRRGLTPEAARDALAAGGRVQRDRTEADRPAISKARLAGFGAAALLWLYLILGLGLLLQAAAQERANRSLEMLLAAARPSEVVLGKLAGVAATLTTHGAASALTGAVVLWALSRLGAPALIAWPDGLPGAALLASGAVTLSAFLMYGTVLVGLGVLARDFPTAENLARPVFVVLVLIIMALGAEVLIPGKPPAWLLFVPPMTPFQALFETAEGVEPLRVIAAVVLQLAVGFCALLAAAPLFRAALGGNGLSYSPRIHPAAQK